MQYLISAFPFQRYSEQGRCAFWVTDDELQPVPEMSVELAGQVLGRTDACGLLYSQQVSLTPGSPLRVGETESSVPEIGDVPTQPGRSVVLYHDRPIYGPSEKIRFRLVAVESGRPLVDASLRVTLESEDGRIVGGLELSTSRCGVAAGELHVPANLTPQTASLCLALDGGQWRSAVRIEAHRPALLLAEVDLPARFAADAPPPVWQASCRYAFGAAVGQGELRVCLQAGVESWLATLPVSGETVEIAVPADHWAALLADAQSLRVSLTLLDRHGKSGEWVRNVPVGVETVEVLLECEMDQVTAGGAVTGRALARSAGGGAAAEMRLVLNLDGEEAARGKTDAAGYWSFSLTAPEQLGEYQLLLLDEDGGWLAGALLAVVDRRPLTLEATIAAAGEALQLSARRSPDLGRCSDLFVMLTDAEGQLCGVQCHQWDEQGAIRCSLQTPGPGSYLLVGMLLAQQAGEPAPRLISEGLQLRREGEPAPEIQLDGLPQSAAPGDALQLDCRLNDSAGPVGDWQLGGWLFDRALMGHGDPLPTPLPDCLGQHTRAISTRDKMSVWPVCCRNWGETTLDIALPPFGELDRAGQSSRRAEESDYVVLASLEEAPVAGELAAGTVEIAELDAACPTVRIVSGQDGWWAPLLEGGPDGIALEIPLPAQITTHELRLCVSDSTGRQAELRAPIQVLRELFIQGDLPAQVTLGDVVELRGTVHNRTGAAVEARVSLTVGDGLTLEGDAERSCSVAAGGSAMLRWVVTAARCGSWPLRLCLGADDAEQLRLSVMPAGPPLIEQSELVPGKACPLPVEADDLQALASLHIVLPALAPFEQLASWSRYTHGCVEQTASRVETAAHVLQYAAAHGLAFEGEPETAALIDQGVGALLACQGPTGWSWYGDGGDPYLTSLVLRALLEARKAGRHLPEQALSQGLIALFRTKDGWHEASGFGAGLPEALLLAEVLGALQGVRDALGTRRVEDAVDELLDDLTRQMLEDPLDDPYLLSIAVLPIAQAHPQLAALAGRLVLDDHQDGGLPRFDGPGGADEALAAACHVLRLSDQTVPPELLRALSRPSLDDLFNTRGLMLRVRELVSLQPESALAGKLTVRVGAETVRAVSLDELSPVAAALALAWIDLSDFVQPGAPVQVDLDPPGLSGLQIHLRTDRWPAEPVVGSALSRRLSTETAALGDPVTVTLSLPQDLPEMSVLQEPLPANARVDAASLDALVEAGVLASWQSTGGVLQLYLERAPEALSYQLIADRPGACTQAGPSLSPMYGSDRQRREGAATTLTVS